MHRRCSHRSPSLTIRYVLVQHGAAPWSHFLGSDSLSFCSAIPCRQHLLSDCLQVAALLFALLLSTPGEARDSGKDLLDTLEGALPTDTGAPPKSEVEASFNLQQSGSRPFLLGLVRTIPFGSRVIVSCGSLNIRSQVYHSRAGIVRVWCDNF